MFSRLYCTKQIHFNLSKLCCFSKRNQYPHLLLTDLKIPLLVRNTKFATCNNDCRQVTYKPYVRPKYTCHDKKNMGLNRPMSPHLTIYAPTLPAMTSIVQRITGTILTFYAIMLSAGTLFLSNGVESYVSMIQSFDFSRPLIFIAKILLGAPFVYHYFNGIRFCAWNYGKWLNMKEVYSTARKSFVLTAALTLLFALL